MIVIAAADNHSLTASLGVGTAVRASFRGFDISKVQFTSRPGDNPSKPLYCLKTRRGSARPMARGAVLKQERRDVLGERDGISRESSTLLSRWRRCDGPNAEAHWHLDRQRR